jgi:hypothetical protein
MGMGWRRLRCGSPRLRPPRSGPLGPLEPGARHCRGWDGGCTRAALGQQKRISAGTQSFCCCGASHAASFSCPAQRSPAQRGPARNTPAQRGPAQSSPAQSSPAQSSPTQRRGSAVPAQLASSGLRPNKRPPYQLPLWFCTHTRWSSRPPPTRPGGTQDA